MKQEVDWFVGFCFQDIMSSILVYVLFSFLPIDVSLSTSCYQRARQIHAIAWKKVHFILSSKSEFQPIDIIHCSESLLVVGPFCWGVDNRKKIFLVEFIAVVTLLAVKNTVHLNHIFSIFINVMPLERSIC